MADRATIALASLATTPLLLGGFAPFTAATTGLLVAAAATQLPAESATPRSRPLALLVACTLAAVAIALLQLVPVPAAVAAWLAPGAAALDATLGAQRAGGRVALSHDPAATRAAALALLIGALLLPVVAAAASRPDARRALFSAVVASAAIVAGLGIVETFLGHPLLQTGLPSHARPFGPFANRNHAAALIVIALPLAVGVAVDDERSGRRRRAAAHFAAAGLLVLGLILNGSRGGLLALLVVMAAVALRAPGRLVIKLVVGALVAAAVVIPGAAWARRHDLTTLGERVTLARDALAMAADAPLTGIGLGAFGAAYPPCQTVAKDLTFRHVESEPIELLVEGGAPLLLLALAAAAVLATVALRVLRRAGIRQGSACDGGAALATFALLAHAGCDFPLRVPGVVVPFLLVVGALLAADARNGATATARRVAA